MTLAEAKQTVIIKLTQSHLLSCCLALAERNSKDAVNAVVADKLMRMWTVRLINSNARDLYRYLGCLSQNIAVLRSYLTNNQILLALS